MSTQRWVRQATWKYLAQVIGLFKDVVGVETTDGMETNDLLAAAKSLTDYFVEKRKPKKGGKDPVRNSAPPTFS